MTQASSDRAAPKGGRPGITSLDHLVIAVADLGLATEHFSALLGRSPSWRGGHPDLGTANTLFGLENTYVELLAPAGDGPVARALEARLAGRGEGLAALAFAVPDVAAAAASLRSRGIDAGTPQAGRGRDAAGGTERRWQWLAIPPAAMRGVPVLLIRHEGDAPGLAPAAPGTDPRATLAGVDHVVIRSDAPDVTRAIYGETLGLRLALDRSFPQWGVRLLFFRVGGLTVEVAVPHALPSDPRAEDELWGVSWRTPDVAAAHERLAESGFEVSPVRTGRRSGTRVFTVRGEPHGVAMLVLGPDPDAPAASR